MELTELGFEDVDWIDPGKEEVQQLIWEAVQMETFSQKKCFSALQFIFLQFFVYGRVHVMKK